MLSKSARFVEMEKGLYEARAAAKLWAGEPIARTCVRTEEAKKRVTVERNIELSSEIITVTKRE